VANHEAVIAKIQAFIRSANEKNSGAVLNTIYDEQSFNEIAAKKWPKYHLG